MSRSSSHFVLPFQGKSAQPEKGSVSWWRNALDRWMDGDAMRLAASQAYTLLLALGPLFLVLISVGHLVLGDSEGMQKNLLKLVDGTRSEAIRKVMLEGLAEARTSAPSKVGLVIGIVGALFSAANIFVELDAAINRLFGNEKRTSSVAGAIKDFFLERMHGVLLVLGTALVLLLASVASATVSAINQVLPEPIPVFTQLISVAVSFVLLGGAFTLCFRVIPDSEVPWRSAAIGGACTALLVALLRVPFSWLVVYVTDYAAYGVVGAVVTVLFWFYFTSCVILLGACLTASHMRAPAPLLPRPPPDAPRSDAPADTPSPPS